MPVKPKSVFLLDKQNFERIYDEQTLASIKELTECLGLVTTAGEILANPAKFAAVEIVFSGWHGHCLDAKLLAVLSHLKACFYGAGSVKGIVSDELWRRDILLTSAYQANAIPVAEYTVAMIILGLKGTWISSAEICQGSFDRARYSVPGVWRTSKVGIISLGSIGRLVCEKLKAFDLDVYAYDPVVSDDVFEACVTTKVLTLEELFSSCDVVSLHAPLIPATTGMVTRALLESMRQGAAFINTSRGMIVDERALIDVLQERSDLTAILDVLQEEGRVHESPLSRMQNVFVTPHIAGSDGGECFRMGNYALIECQRYLEGLSPLARIQKGQIDLLA